MIEGLRGASIWSKDLDNLPPFYRDLLRIARLKDPEGNLIQLLQPIAG